MFSPSQILAPFLTQFPVWLMPLALLGVALVLIFAGSTLVKLVTFLVVGTAGAVFGAALAAQYLTPDWSILGIILGFVIGGLLGVALIPLGIGLVVGYAAYLLALDLALSTTLSLIAGVAFFIVGLALSGKILTVVTAVAGGMLLFNALSIFGLGLMPATVIAAGTTILGLWVQLAPTRRVTQPATTNVGGQPSDRRQ